MSSKMLTMIGLCCCLLLSGCSLIFPSSGQVLTYYNLNIPNCENNSPTNSANQLRLLLRQAYAGGLFSGRKLIFSENPDTLATYQYAAWAQSPAERIPQLLLRRLECENIFRSITMRSSSTAADFLLNLELLDFQHDVAGQSNEVVLSLRSELIDLRLREVKSTRVFSKRLTATSRDAVGAVHAFKQGLTELLEEITDWIKISIRE